MKDLEKILHVEDEPDIQEIARLALESIGGLTVLTCGSGIEAVDKAPSYRPDLILLDVMMPDMDGPETLKELRNLPETKDTPIVFMTAKAMPIEIFRFKDLGAVDVIVKPFDPATLSDQLKSIWNKIHG